MNELPPRAKEWLVRARQGETPPDGAQERVRQRLTAVVGTSAAATLDRTLDSSLNATGVSSTTATTTMFAAATTKLLFIGGAIAALGGALLANHLVSVAPAAHESARATASAEVSTPGQVAIPSQVGARAPTTRTADAPAPVQGPARPADAQASHSSVPRNTQTNLREEMALLAAASDALNKGDTARAHEQLAAHRKRFPRGELREESRGLALLADCMANQPGTAARVSTYLRSVPNGVLSARLESTCGGSD
jgi:hypothetical protein